MRNNQAPFRLGTTQVVAIGASSAVTTNAFGADTRLIRLAATGDCHFAIGDAPTATTSHPILPAGTVDYFIVDPSDKVAAIQADASTGSLSVTEVSK